MTRNLKALGLALVAMLALGAMSASAASATDVFTSTQNPETITGSGSNNVFTIGGIKSIECSTAIFHGTVPDGSTQATFDAAHVGTVGATHEGHCNSSLGRANVDMNECGYILTGETTGADGAETDATVWVECEGGSKIEVTFPDAGNTILSIPAQTPTEGGVTYTNDTPSVGEMTIHTTATGITYSCSPHFLCTLGGVPTEGNNSVITGTVVAHGAAGDIEISS